MSVYVVAALTAKAGAAEQLRQICTAGIPGGRKEAGCLAYDFLQSAGDGSFLYLEQWEDRAAFEGHLTGPNVAAWGKATDGLIASITIDVIYPEKVERL